MPTFDRTEAKAAASFLAQALHEYSGHKGVYGESNAQRMLYSYLVGKFGSRNVRKEEPAFGNGRIDFLVLGPGGAAIELLVRQPSEKEGANRRASRRKGRRKRRVANAGTAARTYILPQEQESKHSHIRDNVRKLLHFRGEEPYAHRFLIVVDRHKHSVSWTDVRAAYREAAFTWRGPRQEWHNNFFRLVYATIDGTVAEAIIRARNQTK